MLEKLSEIQAFINWCKKNKVKSFKNGDLEFILSDYAFIEEDQNMPNLPTEEVLNQREAASFEETQTQKEMDDLLFWSSNE